jgi:hypothetical protein
MTAKEHKKIKAKSGAAIGDAGKKHLFKSYLL